MVRKPEHNVIILTGGRNGSSVLAGLLARAGYWLGENTKRVAYETFENSELVDLNNRVLRETDYRWRVGSSTPPSIERIRDLGGKMESAAFKAFLEQNNQHGPWLWKDPRLCYTMYFWLQLHDFADCKFVVITRDLKQAWTGVALRGKSSESFGTFQKSQIDIVDAAHGVLKESGLAHHPITFEELVVEPEKAIDGLNRFLGLDLEVDDLSAVYRGTLYRKRWSRVDFVKARLKALARSSLMGGPAS